MHRQFEFSGANSFERKTKWKVAIVKIKRINLLRMDIRLNFSI